MVQMFLRVVLVVLVVVLTQVVELHQAIQVVLAHQVKVMLAEVQLFKPANIRLHPVAAAAAAQDLQVQIP